MARASRSKRSVKGPKLALMATSRLRRVSRAFHTSPMPPAPRAERISYGPSRVPGASAMESAEDYRIDGDPDMAPIASFNGTRSHGQPDSNVSPVGPLARQDR